MSDDHEEDGAIGYGRPPKAHQFKRGTSGNPKGRPKGSKNYATILAEEFSALIPINDAGRRRNMEAKRLLVRQLARKAAAGDLRAIGMALPELHWLTEKAEAAQAAHASPSSSDDERLADILTRIIEASDSEPPSEDAQL